MTGTVIKHLSFSITNYIFIPLHEGTGGHVSTCVHMSTPWRKVNNIGCFDRFYGSLLFMVKLNGAAR